MFIPTILSAAAAAAASRGTTTRDAFESQEPDARDYDEADDKRAKKGRREAMKICSEGAAYEQ